MGQSDVPLNNEHIQNFAFDALPHNVSKILCSPLQRCVKTAEVLKEQYESIYKTKLTIVCLPILTERNMGKWEGQLKDNIKRIDSNLFRDNHLIPYITPPNGEPFIQFTERGKTALKVALEKLRTGNLIICSHNQMLKLLVHLFYKDSKLSYWTKISFQYGKIININYFSKLFV